MSKIGKWVENTLKWLTRSHAKILTWTFLRTDFSLSSTMQIRCKSHTRPGSSLPCLLFHWLLLTGGPWEIQVETRELWFSLWLKLWMERLLQERWRVWRSFWLVFHTYIPMQVHQSPAKPALHPNVKKNWCTHIFKVSAHTASTYLQPVFAYPCFKKVNAQTQQATPYMYD